MFHLIFMISLSYCQDSLFLSFFNLPDHCRYLQVTVDILMTQSWLTFLIVLHLLYISLQHPNYWFQTITVSRKYLILSVPALNIYSVIKYYFPLICSPLFPCWGMLEDLLNLFLILMKILIFSSTSLTIDRKSGCLVTGCLIRYIVYFCSQLLRFFRNSYVKTDISSSNEYLLFVFFFNSIKRTLSGLSKYWCLRYFIEWVMEH